MKWHDIWSISLKKSKPSYLFSLGTENSIFFFFSALKESSNETLSIFWKNAYMKIRNFRISDFFPPMVCICDFYKNKNARLYILFLVDESITCKEHVLRIIKHLILLTEFIKQMLWSLFKFHQILVQWKKFRNYDVYQNL